ncbi:hypothetical protein FSARC_1627 [Fusarium sarcochroum]|uniref:DUF1479-domain-containing protein n=1 Tax=Fusarium sarcochroum TaxID=1208366 RepID=A0A8H4U878_9HYPO|nr:hypothetical protein FSARC_1627 [Fusarium sarcochroum]
MSILSSRSVAEKCLKCPTFRAGKCAGTIATTRRLATDAVPLTRKNKKEGDISSVFTSCSGQKAEPLPERFRDLKSQVTVGFEEQIQKSWDDLVEVLKVRTEEVATKRESTIPQVQFSDIQANTVPSASIEGVRRTGVAVIRGVMPKDSTEALLKDVRGYLSKHAFKGFPSDTDKKVVYESYWSPSQVKARSHPNMLATQTWMNQFYTAGADQKTNIKKWQDYSPWDLTGRLDANMNMYDGPGGCSVFRTFQGWLGLSRHGPQQGTLVVHPILQPSTAYWMLRPFFKPTRKGSLDGWKFSLDDDDGNVFLHGANPGTAQEHNPDHHPHLRLSETMIPYPTVEPGDTVFWSADTIHGTENNNTGDMDACVFYIPSVPLTPNNAHYVAQQRDAFLQGIPPPDFPGGSGESEFSDRGTTKDILSDSGRLAMGLSPLNTSQATREKESLVSEVNKILDLNIYFKFKSLAEMPSFSMRAGAASRLEMYNAQLEDV